MTVNANASIALLLKCQTSNPKVVGSSPRHERSGGMWPKMFSISISPAEGATYTCKVTQRLKTALKL